MVSCNVSQTKKLQYMHNMEVYIKKFLLMAANAGWYFRSLNEISLEAFNSGKYIAKSLYL